VPNGVPFGEAGYAPVLFTAFGGQKSPHMAWYGTSGAGKGFGLRVLLSREHFQKDLRIFVVDSDEQGEYAGRFCSYLHGRHIAVGSLEPDLPDVALWAVDTLRSEFTAGDLGGIVPRETPSSCDDSCRV
jgi:hypothetical protein